MASLLWLLTGPMCGIVVTIIYLQGSSPVQNAPVRHLTVFTAMLWGWRGRGGRGPFTPPHFPDKETETRVGCQRLSNLAAPLMPPHVLPPRAC